VSTPTAEALRRALSQLRETERAGRGCQACYGGYVGRFPIGERLVIGEEISDRITGQITALEIEPLSHAPTLLENGRKQVRNGRTTTSDILREVIIRRVDGEVRIDADAIHSRTRDAPPVDGMRRPRCRPYCGGQISTCEHAAERHGVESGHEAPAHGMFGQATHRRGAGGADAGRISYVTFGTWYGYTTCTVRRWGAGEDVLAELALEDGAAAAGWGPLAAADTDVGAADALRAGPSPRAAATVPWGAAAPPAA